MTYKRSSDFDLLDRLARNAGLYPFLSDDYAPPMEEWELPQGEALWYIVAADDGGPFGFWLFIPLNTIRWEFHTVMPLNVRALAAMRELLGPGGWLWSNTPCERAITGVPDYNAIALRFGRRAGLTEFGRDPKSYRKHQQLQDLILMGISKDQ